jgi:hypothetical protein
LLANHRKWDHGFLSLPVIPKQENKKGCPGSTKKTDNLRAVPGELISTVLKGQQELDCGRCKKGEAKNIKLTRQCVNSDGKFLFRYNLWDVDKSEHNCD